MTKKRHRDSSKKKNSSKRLRSKQSGGGTQPVCNQNINNLLVPEYKSIGASLSGNPKTFTNDIKKQASAVENVAKGNWLAGPGPPPPLPKCIIM